jgi:hypothetical protein
MISKVVEMLRCFWRENDEMLEEVLRDSRGWGKEIILSKSVNHFASVFSLSEFSFNEERDK